MAVHLIVCRIKEEVFVGRCRSNNICATHYPDAHAFHAAGVYIAGIFNGHFGIGCVQAARMLVCQSVLTANKYFPQGPVAVAHTC